MTPRAYGWSLHQVRGFVLRAHKANKALWDLVPSARTALLAMEFTTVVSDLARESVPTAWLSDLWTEMVRVAQLENLL